MCSLLDEVTCAGIIEPQRFPELHQDGKELVRQWTTRAIEARTDEPLAAFVFLWFSVNAWGACVADTDRDFSWVNRVAGDARLRQSFEDLLGAEDCFCANAHRFHELWPIFDSRYIKRADLYPPEDGTPREGVIEYYLQDVDRYEPRCWEEHGREVPLDWPHTFRTAYRVRCNLFHGHKRLTDSNRQIVGSVFDVLRHFLVDHEQLLEEDSRA